MPATFLTLQKGDIFNSTGSADTLVQIPKVDEIVGKEGIAIYNSVSYQINETIQYFMTFDDIIKFIHFGKGLGTVQVDGTLYCDCEGDLPGLKKFSSAVSGLRGETQEITIGEQSLTCVMNSAQVTVVSEPDTMAHFTFSFSIIQHDM